MNADFIEVDDYKDWLRKHSAWVQVRSIDKLLHKQIRRLKREKVNRDIIAKKSSEIQQWNTDTCSCKSIEELDQLIQTKKATINKIPHSAEYDKTQHLMNTELLKAHADKITALLAESTEADRLSIEHGKTSIGSAIKAGEIIIAAKILVRHGDWAKWIQDNCNISQDTATRYMKLAKTNTTDPELLKDVTSLKEAYLACGAIKPAKRVKGTVTEKPTVPNGISYLRNGFNSQRFSLPDTASFLNDFKEMLEDIDLLKPLADYYTIKTKTVGLNKVEVQEAVGA
jgi:hypothetical protein